MTVRTLTGDCRTLLASLDAGSVQTCVTSPPYFNLRDYGIAGQIGLESTPDAFVAELVAVFREVKRVLRVDGTLWLNLGETRWDGFQLGIPWRVVFAMQADGWLLVNDVIWQKPNIVPVNAPRRLTVDHEFVFLFATSESYWFDGTPIMEPLSDASASRYRYAFTGARGRDGRLASQAPSGMKEMPTERRRRTVWTIPASDFKGGHFATFPPALIEPCILAGSRPGDTVLDPFGGAGTTGLVADRLGRDAVLIELNPEYAAMARARVHDDAPLFSDGAA